jgi:hypothetical protein
MSLQNGQFNELTMRKQTPQQNSGNETILKWVRVQWKDYTYKPYKTD